MSSENIAIRSYFAKLGLEPDLADLYIALHTYGPQAIMPLSRNAKVERTRLYRLIDAMVDAHLVEVETHHKRNIYRAAPISNLQILLSRKEEELRNLQNELHHLDSLLSKDHIRSPLTHVQFYRGSEGIKQMMWNQTKANTENLAILYENMQSKTNSTYFQRWVERCNDTGIHFRGIISDHFIKTQQEWYSKHSNERLAHWESRYVPGATFPITHSTITYDDVVAYYNWKDGEVFGVELYNAEIAAAQRNFFGMLWAQSQPVDDLIGPKNK